MQSLLVQEQIDESTVPKRTISKLVVAVGVVLLVVAGVASVQQSVQNESPVTFLAKTKDVGSEEDPFHVMPSNAVISASEDALPYLQHIPGQIEGAGTWWVKANGKNCPDACGSYHLVAVQRGIWHGKPFYVCGARGSAQYPGMRAGFNLLNWNPGKCCIAYGSWLNKPNEQCLCKEQNAKSKWVSNQKKYSTCQRTCEVNKMVAISSGAFMGVASNPRYEVCAAWGGHYDGRIGWNLGLIPFGQWCASGYGHTYTQTTHFDCYCDVPMERCLPLQKPKKALMEM